MNARDIALLLGVGTGVALVLGYVGKQQIGAAVDTVSGYLSGKNALTASTPYDGAGIMGTIGAGANALSGGLLQSAGEWLGGKAADLSGY